MVFQGTWIGACEQGAGDISFLPGEGEGLLTLVVLKGKGGIGLLNQGEVGLPQVPVLLQQELVRSRELVSLAHLGDVLQAAKDLAAVVNAIGVSGATADLGGRPAVVADEAVGDVQERESQEGSEGKVFPIHVHGGVGMPCLELVQAESGTATEQIGVGWSPIVEQGLQGEIVVGAIGEAQLSDQLAVLPKAPVPVAIGYISSGLLDEGDHLAGDFVRGKVIIGIKPLNVVALRVGETEVTGVVGSALGTVQDLEGMSGGSSEGLSDRHGFVGGAVIGVWLD